MKSLQEQESIQIMQFITAKWISKPLYVAAKLGIADILSEGPQSIHYIAEKCDAFSPYLYRIMRALASIGIFTENQNKVFSQTRMSECLKNGEMRSIILMFLSEWHELAWDKLYNSVKTGQIAFELAHNMPCFDWFKHNKEAGKIFNEANSIKAIGSHGIIVEHYDFQEINTITDIGGGYGGLMIQILKKNPLINGVIADTPDVIQHTNNIIKEKGLADRCKTTNCNFFESIPSGSDAYILSHILHDWNDPKCHKILKNCNEAMSKNAKLLVVEMIVPERNEFSISKLLDIEVLVMGGGAERTSTEYRKLLSSAGFNIIRIIPTKGNISIIECIKVV